MKNIKTISFTDACGIVYSVTEAETKDVMIVNHTSKCNRRLVIPSTVTDPETGVEYGVISISDRAFEDYGNLFSVVIPASVTSIGTSAFENCTDLTSASIPASVMSIGNFAFCNIKGKIEVVDENLNYSAEDGVLFNKDKTSLLQCGTERLAYEIPCSVQTIGDYAFWGCRSLSSITIPSSVKSIGYKSFENCTSLVSLEIPEGVVRIGWGAFRYCNHLLSVIIPSSTKRIGWGAFLLCDKMKLVMCHAKNPAAIDLGKEVFAYIQSSACKLIVPLGCKDAYAKALQWKDFCCIEETETWIYQN